MLNVSFYLPSDSYQDMPISSLEKNLVAKENSISLTSYGQLLLLTEKIVRGRVLAQPPTIQCSQAKL